ncbi:hypothetical protein BKA56DRAFT_579182 [Ilyonectria sp. MPI-CAGE-AT-0026]|nr:hypothetical protein BKA56DRAFT_579182 [Ilyonectria sp. MPI-CAGE-AT-0026]
MKASVCLRYGLQPRAKPQAKLRAKSLSIPLIIAHCKNVSVAPPSPAPSAASESAHSAPVLGRGCGTAHKLQSPACISASTGLTLLCRRPLDYRDPTSAASSPPTLDVAANSCSPFAPYLNPFVSVAFSFLTFRFQPQKIQIISTFSFQLHPSTPSSVSCSPPATEFCSATPPNNNHPAKVTLSQRSRLDLDHSSRQDVFQSPQLVCALSPMLWLLDAQRPPNHRNTQC